MEYKKTPVMSENLHLFELNHRDYIYLVEKSHNKEVCDVCYNTVRKCSVHEKT